MPLTTPLTPIGRLDAEPEQAPARLVRLRWGVAGFIAAYILAAQIVLLVLPGRAARTNEWFSVWMKFAPVVILPLVLGALVHGRHTARDAEGNWIPFPEGWRAGWRKARQSHLSNGALGRMALLFLVVPAFHRAFTVIKSSLVLVIPYWADPYLLRLDSAVHGGLPHTHLSRWLAHDGFVIGLDRAYLGWHFLLLATVFWVAMQSDAAYRLRAMIAFLATWVLLGNVLAGALNSAGPWAYGLVTGLPSPYTGLTDRLQAVHATSHLYLFAVEHRLWANYSAGHIGLGSGISAMPSLHVAMPILGALVARPKSRTMAGLLAAYALVILVGSVALAWHYAVDGYLSLLLVPLIWLWSGRVMRWAEA